jgi:hypothetical protein
MGGMCIPRLAACLSILLLAACAGSGTQTVAPLATRLPDMLLVFHRQDMTVLPTTPPSIAIRYRHEATSGTATVVLRPPAGAPVPDGIDSAVVRQEVGGLTLTLIGTLEDVPVVRLPDHTVTRRGDNAAALRCGNLLVPVAQEMVRREMLCVGGVAGHLLTVRVAGLHPADKAGLAHVLFSGVAMQAWQSLRQDAPPAASGAETPETEPPLPGVEGPVFRL